MNNSPLKRTAIFGGLSLIALLAAIFIGIFRTASILSRTSEMGSWTALQGILEGFIASVLSLVLAVIGLARGEQPAWPASLGFFLSLLPGIFGLAILLKLLERWYIG